VASGTEVAGSLRGFLSFDAPEPAAFLKLFHTIVSVRRLDNEGSGLKPREEIEVFYGTADSIATIIMLKEGPTTTEGDQDEPPDR
jgi:hypothetical protein